MKAIKMWDPQTEPLDQRQTPEYLLLKYKKEAERRYQSQLEEDINRFKLYEESAGKSK